MFKFSFILKKYGNPYQNTTSSIESFNNKTTNIKCSHVNIIRDALAVGWRVKSLVCNHVLCYMLALQPDHNYRKKVKAPVVNL